MKLSKFAYIAILVILVAVFGVSAWHVGSYFLESSREQEKFDELAALKEQALQQTQPAETTVPPATDPADPTEETEPTEPTEPGMRAEYAAIYEQNNDVVGWIKIDGTKIDYPVMQTPDRPNYYIDHNFEGEKSKHGCIYIREECDMNEPSDNITVYGHNMADGSMFAALMEYQDKEAWDNNPLIFFDTLTEYHTYKIFAVFKTTASLDEGFKYHHMIDASGKTEFDNFIATCKELSFYSTGITPKYGDKIICLSTCEYTLEHGRLVVAAVRIT